MLLGIPGIVFVLMASTQVLESSTDPSPFLDFVTDTIGDTASPAAIYAKFELCPIGLDYGDPIDTAWYIESLELGDTSKWLRICGFYNSGCVISNILLHVDDSEVPWFTNATPPVEVARNKFLLWAVVMFRRHIPLWASGFWPLGNKSVCVLDVVADDNDYVTTNRFFNSLLSPAYSHMTSTGMNLYPADSFWVSLLFQAPSDLLDLRDTIPRDPRDRIIVHITAEPAASR
jgi:hypothetical protein